MHTRLKRRCTKSCGSWLKSNSDLKTENLSCLKPAFALLCLLQSKGKACSQPTAARGRFSRLLINPTWFPFLPKSKFLKHIKEQEWKPYERTALLFKGQADVPVFQRVRRAPPGRGSFSKGRIPQACQHPAFWQSHRWTLTSELFH